MTSKENDNIKVSKSFAGFFESKEDCIKSFIAASVAISVMKAVKHAFLGSKAIQKSTELHLPNIFADKPRVKSPNWYESL